MRVTLEVRSGPDAGRFDRRPAGTEVTVGRKAPAQFVLAGDPTPLAIPLRPEPATALSAGSATSAAPPGPCSTASPWPRRIGQGRRRDRGRLDPPRRPDRGRRPRPRRPPPPPLAAAAVARRPDRGGRAYLDAEIAPRPGPGSTSGPSPARSSRSSTPPETRWSSSGCSNARSRTSRSTKGPRANGSPRRPLIWSSLPAGVAVPGDPGPRRLGQELGGLPDLRRAVRGGPQAPPAVPHGEDRGGEGTAISATTTRGSSGSTCRPASPGS